MKILLSLIFIIFSFNLFSETKTENYLPEFLSKFRNLADHWKLLETKYKRDLNGLVFPDGFSFTFDKKITTPKLSIPFNDYRENSSDKSNLVEPRGIEPLTSTLPA